MTQTEFRNLPGVDTLVADVPSDGIPEPVRMDLARAAIEEARTRIGRGEPCPDGAWFRTRLEAESARYRRGGLQTVLNATGVVIHTNLGRAPMSEAAVEAVRAVAGFTNLELSLETGERGGRGARVEGMLVRLSGAEAACVVNNNAAAVLLALAVAGSGREAVISRGELVQIGGGFRIPDILEASGVRLKEVGTTNVVTRDDYARAIGPETGMILQVHRSNFTLQGFTEGVPLSDLVALGREKGIPVLSDLGSGCLLDTRRAGLGDEPTVAQVVADDPDLVCFSGDKLLGGPQAGLVVGRKEWIDRLKKAPMYRALRVGKLIFAGLEATLAAYLDGRAAEGLPVWRMLTMPAERIRERAEALAKGLGGASGVSVEVVPGESRVGGGALPEAPIPTFLVSIRPPSGEAEIARRLRLGAPAVMARIEGGALLLDLRTVPPAMDKTLADAVRVAVHTIGVNGNEEERGRSR